MTKREVRILILGELALQPKQIIWDIGAGTGSVSIEIARLSETFQVYAIEKTAIGSSLIEQNCRRLQVKNVISIHGSAPDILQQLPAPNRIFIGGSGGNLNSILDSCNARLATNGIVVLALATLEHLNIALGWLNSQRWEYRLLQVQLSRSIPVGQLTRFTPLNPVTIVTATRQV
jgi:precorrin-6Y C5,15-methyltransferase (decarboxylating)